MTARRSREAPVPAPNPAQTTATAPGAAQASRLALAAAPVAARLGAWWCSLPKRERHLLQAASLLLALAVLWSLFIAPAWRTLQRAPAERAQLEAQWAEMQALADEAAQLRAAPALSPDGQGAALQAAVDRLGGRAQLSLQTDRAVIKLQGVGLQQLGPWLQELRAAARTRPLELSLSRSAAGYSGLLVVSREVKP